MTTETTSKSSAGRKRARHDQQPPAWANELVIKYQSNIAHTFLVHGNVRDYVGGLAGQSLKNYLIESFSTRDLVVCWDRASGFSLPTAPMRQRFIDIAGIPLPGSSSTGAGAAARGGGLAGGLNRAAAQTSGSDLAAILEKIRKPEDALDILSRVLHWRPPKHAGQDDTPFRVAVILDYAESIAPATEAAASETDRTVLTTLTSWGQDRTLGDREHILVMIASEPHDLNERLHRKSSGWEHIEVPFPTLEERATFIESLVAGDSDMRLAEGLSAQEMARLCTGLRYMDLEDILLRASYQHQAVDRALIKQRKDEIMSSEFADVLHITEVETGFEGLGGLEEVKRDLRDTVVAPMRSGDLRLVPQGVLLMGPAGTGKTRLAKALARESGVTFVELDLSKIFSKWVGDTERRLERAIEAIVAWRPCIVFVDEIDQSVGRGESGDSGVSNRVFKRLMEVMADTTLRGHVLWICASVTGDTPVLVRQQGVTRFAPIGEVIDAYFDHEDSGEALSPDLEALAMLPDQRIGWSRVTSVFRHPVETVYDVVYGSGEARITATGNHSVFVLDKEANIIARPVSTLCSGDLLVTPVQSSFPRQSDLVIDLIDRRTQKAQELLDGVVAMAQHASQRAVAAHFGIGQTQVSQYARRFCRPRGLAGTMPHSAAILDEDLAWFLGLFTAEGYARTEVCITLGEQENDLALRAERVMTEKFGLEVRHRVTDGAHHLIMRSAPLARRLKELVGCDAHNKHVPSVLWEAERNLVLAYIKGWMDGDGTTDTSSDHATITTVSKSLAYQGLWLLRMNGIATRIDESAVPSRQMKGGRVLKATTAYRLHITGGENPWAKRQRQQKNGAHDKRVPVALMRGVYQRLNPRCPRNHPQEYAYLSDPQRQFVSRASARTILQAVYDNRRRDDPIYERLLPFVFGDLGVTPIQRIEQRPYDGTVYDFCGCDNESFIGGELPILLHNTNRADLLDAALLRPGRMDKKIPILAPDADERAAILAVLTRAGFAGSPEKDFPTPEQYARLSEPMIDYTGAEIEGIVGKAVQLRARNRRLSILEALQQAYEKILPTTQNIGLMTRLALLYCNDLDLVPEEHRELARALRHPGARAELLEEQEATDLSPRRPRRRDW